MNRLEFNIIGGFPLTTRILNELQKAYTVFNSLGSLAGNLTIIDGCITTGSNVSNGVVFINGEVLEFRGGIAQTKVIVKEDAEALVFENGTPNNVIKTRYATFGTGLTTYEWVDFKRGIEIKNIPTDIGTYADRLTALEKKNAVFSVSGGIVVWGKAANLIPPGWEEWTPARGRVLIGLDETDNDFKPLGKTGGSKSLMMLIKHLVRHKHKTNWGTSTLTPPDGFDGTTPGASGYDNNKKNYLTSSTMYDVDGVAAPAQEAMPLLNPYRIVEYIHFTNVT